MEVGRRLKHGNQGYPLCDEY